MSSPQRLRSPRSPRTPRSTRYNSPGTPKTPKASCKPGFSPTMMSPSLPAVSISAMPSPISPLPSLAFPLPPVESLHGLPGIDVFGALQEDYLSGLSCTKRDKALIDTKTYVDILEVLRDPHDINVASPQFRFWVRKMFRLEDSVTASENSDERTQKPSVVLHDGKRVALKNELYAILCEAHNNCGHGGRDNTYKEIRETWRFVPKELVSRFVKVCPTCVKKRTHRRTASAGRNSPTKYLSEDDYGTDSNDDCEVGRRATLTPRASATLQIANRGLDLPLELDANVRPCPSVPRLLISPASEFPPKPFTFRESSFSAGSSTAFSALFSNNSASSSATSPSESDFNVPLGSAITELLTNFKPAPMAQPRRSHLRPGSFALGRRSSADDLRQITSQHYRNQRPIARARSMDAFGTTQKVDIPLDPALALYPPPLSLAKCEVHSDSTQPGEDLSAPSSRRSVPGPINVQAANAPFLVRSQQSPELEADVSPALSPFWVPSCRVSSGAADVRESVSSPALSCFKTGAVNGEVDFLPSTPSSAASVWSQDSAPNSAVFWDANARAYIDSSDSETDGHLDSDFARLLMGPSTLGLLTLQDCANTERLGKMAYGHTQHEGDRTEERPGGGVTIGGDESDSGGEIREGDGPVFFI